MHGVYWHARQLTNNECVCPPATLITPEIARALMRRERRGSNQNRAANGLLSHAPQVVLLEKAGNWSLMFDIALGKVHIAAESSGMSKVRMHAFLMLEK